MECEGCIYQDDITNACANDECEDGSGFVKALDAEDMFKVLFMLIYNLQGSVDFSREDLDNVTDGMKLEPSYDAEKKRYVLETKPQPPEVVLVKVPRGVRNRKIVKPRLILPMN